MADQIEVELLVFGYLINEIGKLRHGWGRKERARKKMLRRQLNEGWRVLRNFGVLGQHRKRSPYVADIRTIMRRRHGNA